MVRLALVVVCLVGACGDEPPARERITIGGTADGAGVVVAESTAAHAECSAGQCEIDAGLGSVTLTATANTGHAFRGWSGETCDGYTGSGDAITFDAASSSHSCVARFIQRITVGGTAGTGGSVVAASTSTDASCVGSSCTVDAGAGVVSLTAIASAGFRFAAWTGAGCAGGSANGAAITFTNPTSDVTCDATFSAQVVVTGNAGIGGAVVASSSSSGVTCSGNMCGLDAGAGTVTLTATPGNGYRFGAWSGSSCTGGTISGATITFTNPTTNVTCNASFVARVSVAGTATTGGSVAASSTSANATCAGSTCTVDSGAGTVTLTATVTTGYRFAGWTGATCTGGTTNGAVITFTNPTSNVACDATFIRRVTVAGTGTGGTVSATSSAASATCSGGSCEIDAAGGNVRLTATVSSGFRFVNWSGAACPTATPNDFSIVFVDPADNVACTANFVARVTVTGTTTGGGTLAASSTSANASCAGASCAIDSGAGTVVLTATASSDFRFVGWGSSCTDGVQSGATITFTNPIANVSCSALFIERVTVSGTASPLAGGSVAASSVSANATCSGATCTIDRGVGTVTLTANASNGYRFVAWSGCSTATTAAINITNPTASVSCTATFVQRFTVAVATIPSGFGSVSLAGGGCSGSSCTVDAGTFVTFSAFDGDNARFIRWSGNCSSTSSAFQLEITANTSCVAEFYGTWAVSHDFVDTSERFVRSLVLTTGELGFVGHTDVTGFAAVTVTRVDPNTGEPLRTVILSSDNVDRTVVDAVATPDSGLLVLANTDRPVLTKLDKDDAVEWERSYDAQGVFSRATALTAMQDGSYTFIARSEFDFATTGMLRTTRVDPQGVVLWDRIWGTSTTVGLLGRAVVEPAMGGILVAGQYESDPPRTFVSWIDENGGHVWTNIYGTTADAFDIRALVLGDNDDVVALGHVLPDGVGTDSHGFAMSIDSGAGGLYWAYAIEETTGTEVFQHATRSRRDGVVAVGRYGLEQNAWFVEIGWDGAITDAFQYGGGGNEHALGIASVPDGGYALACSATTWASTGTDGWSLRITDDGGITFNVDAPVATFDKTNPSPSAIDLLISPFDPLDGALTSVVESSTPQVDLVDPTVTRQAP